MRGSLLESYLHRPINVTATALPETERHIMDGDSFDRLSVVVHRLRDTATRRGALGLLLGGSVAAVSGLLAGDAEARRRNRNKKNSNCRGFGGKCRSNK